MNLISFFKIQNNELIKEKFETIEYAKKITTKEELFLYKFDMINTLIEISNYTFKKNTNKLISQENYWKEIKNINKILKTLITPRYFIKKDGQNLFDYVELFMEINAIYYSKFYIKIELISLVLLMKILNLLLKILFNY